MATSARLVYTHIDRHDRSFFDHVLDDTECHAFVLYFERIESDRYPKKKRPRTGRGRITLWNKSRRAYWIGLAQAVHPAPTIVRTVPAVVAQASGPVSLLPPTPPPPPPPPPPPSILVVPVASGTTVIDPAPTLRPEDEPQPANLPVTSPAKRRYENRDDPNIAPWEPPAKRLRPDVGGERRPPFVLHNHFEKNKDAHLTRSLYLAPTREQREYIQQTLGDGWRYAKTLSQNDLVLADFRPRQGFPTKSVFLFVKLDDNSIIEDAVAVKIVDLSLDKDLAAKARAQREISAVHALHDLASRHILQYRGEIELDMRFDILAAHTENRDPSLWTQQLIFSTFAHGGDLHKLIENHALAGRPIPEHFCWFVFKSLVEALITLQTGPNREGWRSMLHLDIKPKNILLNDSDPTYTSYRTPVLADFDSSLRLSSHLPTRESETKSVRWGGTNFWQAPEQCAMYKDEKRYTPKDWKLDQSTDIYGLGLVMRFMMMCCQSSINGTAWNYTRIEAFHNYERSKFPGEAEGLPKTPEYEFSWSNYPGVYSSALIKAVRKCLAFRGVLDPTKKDKRHRPTLIELEKLISSNISRLDLLYGDKLEAAQQRPEHPLHVLFPETDSRFAIGATFEPEQRHSIEKLIRLSITDDERYAARESHANIIARLQDQSEREASLPSRESLEQALEKVIDQVRPLMTQSDMPELNVLALHFARTTILKCVNPEATFVQKTGKQALKFFAPETKHFILSYLKSSVAGLAQEKNQMIKKRVAEMQKLEGIDPLTDENIEEESKKAEILGRLEEMALAFVLLEEATQFGLNMLTLGEELSSTLGEGQYHKNHVTKISDVHKGVWEYFWSCPSGVFEEESK
ncbi:kinase-like protein [Dothidotthia symphoricarpi CBS 119687]|uniref:non-specific serine/threonine protein kinase n=1 Tax=Dothidotthia symphoricarpi CBS 119687 TaxID=1392245 RepID=A0A6A6AVD3_9PLEO|nr:kinase-like protein [Dothidotthia symphoricarpi CBS 119687]KAF2134925.1 kinase-like protein [Dothidotthia symphoricarpi CBS 119687]